MLAGGAKNVVVIRILTAASTLIRLPDKDIPFDQGSAGTGVAATPFHVMASGPG
jgi:hypothetical protein